MNCYACEYKVEKQGNGNCPYHPGYDGFPVQCVGAWACDKHTYLGKYIEATKAVRKKFLPPGGKGGSAYIDLFSGPGIARVRDTGGEIDGSPLLAMKHDFAPFSKIILCDIDSENVQALRERTKIACDRVVIMHGDSNQIIDDVLSEIPRYGLNIALVDPFALKGLHWRTLCRLGEASRMDLIINFHTGFIKRNFLTPGYDNVIDNAIGDKSWRKSVTSMHDIVKLIDIMKANLHDLGYSQETANAYGIVNGKSVLMYHLVYATKHPLGNRIWDSIGKMEPSGQVTMGF